MATSAKRKATAEGPSARSPNSRKTHRSTRTANKKAPAIAQPVGGHPSVAAVGLLRKEFALNRPTLAQMLGVTPSTLAHWEKETAELDDSDKAKIKRVARILRSL